MLPRCKLNVAVCGAGVAALQPMYAYHHLLAPLVKFKLGSGTKWRRPGRNTTYIKTPWLGP